MNIFDDDYIKKRLSSRYRQPIHINECAGKRRVDMTDYFEKLHVYNETIKKIQSGNHETVIEFENTKKYLKEFLSNATREELLDKIIHMQTIAMNIANERQGMINGNSEYICAIDMRNWLTQFYIAGNYCTRAVPIENENNSNLKSELSESCESYDMYFSS